MGAGGGGGGEWQGRTREAISSAHSEGLRQYTTHCSFPPPSHSAYPSDTSCSSSSTMEAGGSARPISRLQKRSPVEASLTLITKSFFALQ